MNESLMNFQLTAVARPFFTLATAANLGHVNAINADEPEIRQPKAPRCRCSQRLDYVVDDATQRLTYDEQKYQPKYPVSDGGPAAHQRR